jgi:hypothetical protein
MSFAGAKGSQMARTHDVSNRVQLAPVRAEQDLAVSAWAFYGASSWTIGEETAVRQKVAAFWAPPEHFSIRSAGILSFRRGTSMPRYHRDQERAQIVRAVFARDCNGPERK